jgi:hypothetical protein
VDDTGDRMAASPPDEDAVSGRDPVLMMPSRYEEDDG